MRKYLITNSSAQTSAVMVKAESLGIESYISQLYEGHGLNPGGSCIGFNAPTTVLCNSGLFGASFSVSLN